MMRFAGATCFHDRKRPGIPSCATKSVATDAAVVPESHLPAASAGERKRPSSRHTDHAR